MTKNAADILRHIADQDIGANAPWLADELKEIARKLELEWAGIYTGPRCNCTCICSRPSQPDDNGTLGRCDGCRMDIHQGPPPGLNCASGNCPLCSADGRSGCACRCHV